MSPRKPVVPPSYLYSPQRYERKLIAFYDLLGWRDRIAWAENDSSRIGLLSSILRLTAIIESAGSHIRFPQRFSSFSDNVVMSIPVGFRSIDEILFRLGCAQFSTAMMGFYLRGAVTIGNIVHDDFIVFGPGLNRAYELESTVARFPRIVLDPLIISEISPVPDFVACEDGVHFIDTFTERFIARVQTLAEAGYKNDILNAYNIPEPTISTTPVANMVTVIEQLRTAFQTAPTEEARVKLAWIVARMAKAEGMDTSGLFVSAGLEDRADLK